MNFLNWYDWITPTNPYAAIFFGVLFTMILAITVWFDTKKIRTAAIAMATGLSVTLVGVLILKIIGFYG
ncbi:hypothetical protein [Bacillus sp. REN3]|uniref:hypothetical protein n=1 Tax=Bacillus sp. REN3 TaxID=2802440 RepID=UPI001AEE8F06|nr:hypothetical protein [Bacillus sp. REN3]